MMHCAEAVLLIPPTHFAFNAETAADNDFMRAAVANGPSSISSTASAEWSGLCDSLRAAGVDVLPLGPSPAHLPVCPDAVFPNNWISFAADGQLTVFPMAHASRQAETLRLPEVLSLLEERGFFVKGVERLDEEAVKGVAAAAGAAAGAAGAEGAPLPPALEGTGSIVFDHDNRLAYAALSQRTDKALLELHCRRKGYTPVTFHAASTKTGSPIYHTNVLLSVGAGFAVVCGEVIGDLQERETVLRALQEGVLPPGSGGGEEEGESSSDSSSGSASAGSSSPSKRRVILLISEAQMESFCGNVLCLRRRARPSSSVEAAAGVSGSDGAAAAAAEGSSSMGGGSAAAAAAAAAQEHVIAMSLSAWQAFTEEQRLALGECGELLACPVPTIERVGGGSVRCMLAEVFCPRQQQQLLQQSTVACEAAGAASGAGLGAAAKGSG